MQKVSAAILVVIVLAAPIFAADVPKLTEAEKLTIAIIQRNALVADLKMRNAEDEFNAAKAEAEGLKKQLTEKLAAAAKTCTDKQRFDAASLACVAK